MKLKRNLYLASGSPRRRELLNQLRLDFAIIRSEVDETLSGDLEEALALLALKKAEAAAEQAADGLILAADTVVVCDGEVFGKPKDEQDAVRMLLALSGRTHQVKTGVCVLDGKTGRAVTHVESTDVRFLPLSMEQITDYIASGEPADKAGAYAIQGLGAQFVEKINGCYYNVVGLPVAASLRLLKEMGAFG